MLRSRAQILVVTESPSLAIGLTLLPNDWEVTSRTSIGEVRHFDVLVLDLKSTESGLEAVGRDADLSSREGPALPIIIIGDGPADRELPANLVVLARPYTFRDLAQRIEHLLIQGTDGEPWLDEAASSESMDRVAADVIDTQGVTPPPDGGTAPVDRIVDVSDRSIAMAAASAAAEPDGAVRDGQGVIRIPEIDDSAADRRTLIRRRRRSNGTEDAARQVLARALAATAELDLLVDEVPQRASIPAMARVIVEVAAEQLEADTVGLWRHGDLGWTAVAHHGLTPHQATWVVPDGQPLFSEVHRTGGSLLIDPVEQVPAAVAGIGGAFTESFMAISIAAGDHRYGIIAVGRDRPLTGDDLDVLGGFALEAAIGFAVGEHADRLRSAVATSEEADSRPRRSWHQIAAPS